MAYLGAERSRMWALLGALSPAQPCGEGAKVVELVDVRMCRTHVAEEARTREGGKLRGTEADAVALLKGTGQYRKHSVEGAREGT